MGTACGAALDTVPNLGEVRRKALPRRFGSPKRLAVASLFGALWS